MNRETENFPFWDSFFLFSERRAFSRLSLKQVTQKKKYSIVHVMTESLSCFWINEKIANPCLQSLRPVWSTFHFEVGYRRICNQFKDISHSSLKFQPTLTQSKQIQIHSDDYEACWAFSSSNFINQNNANSSTTPSQFQFWRALVIDRY